MGRIKSRKYKDPTKLQVIARDSGMCVVHRGIPAVDVHEIVPKGRASKQEKADPLSWVWDMKNRCCLCRGCHDQAQTLSWRIRLIRLLYELHGYDYSMEPWRQYAPEDAHE